MHAPQPSSVLAPPEPALGPGTPARTAPALPELLAPAGDWDCAKAAVENGADAIYFGLEKFNARMRAHNFTEADLPKLMEFLHRRGVKGYVTFNTLIFENELAQAEQYARTIIAAGVDAAIVQDVGICRMLRRLSPDFPIHVSTQMTITSAGGVEFTRELGCQLVVLARECSLQEIEKIQAAQAQAGVRAMPLEVFVHGALCVAYSGQCLTSEALGGRSANRGECAQACRMPYDLISDGKQVPLGDRKYLLSPQDLASLDLLPQMARLGVASLKIEGRLKSPEYVANITRVYRQALERIQAATPSKAPVGTSSTSSPISASLAPSDGERAGVRGLSSPSSILHPPSSASSAGARGPSSPAGSPSTPPRNTAEYEMEMAFSRGLYTGWFHGINNQRLVHAHFGKKRGVYLGQVAELRREGVLVQLEGPLKPGDGVVFDAATPEEKEEGGRVYEIKPAPPARGSESSRFKVRSSKFKVPPSPAPGPHPVLLTFGRGDIDFRRVHVGDKLWKTSDPELERHLRQSFEGDSPKFQRPIAIEVHGRVGHPLTLIARDDSGHVARMDSAMPLAQAEKQPLSTERLRDQLGRLGGTPFKLGALHNQLEGAVMLPVSELNRLRRELATELETLRARPLRWQLHAGPAPLSAPAVTRLASAPAGAAQLNVLVRNLSQLQAALNCGVQTLYCDFEDPKKYRDAVHLVRAANSQLSTLNSQLFVAPPRIFKMGEEWILKQVRSCEADGYLVRNYDHLQFFAQDRRIGDYSLNVANHLTAEYFRNHFGLERVTASYDLNFTQLEALLQGAPPEWFEVTIHQHMPMFHMEHCVFCAFLSTGTDYTNCGRPCDKHDVKLRDRVGAEHPVKADVGCRNTVYNSLAQTGAEYVPHMLALGVRQFRLEFLNETPEQLTQTLGKYRQLLRGEITGAQLWRELKLFHQLGVTRGQIAKS